MESEISRSNGETNPVQERPTCHLYFKPSMLKAIKKASPEMPWKDNFKLFIEENPRRALLRPPNVPFEHELSEIQLKKLPVDAKLSLWVVVANQYYALLAASGELKRFYPKVRKHDKRFVQFVIASQGIKDAGLARPVVWPFGTNDYRGKAIRKTTIKQFAGSLIAPANFRGERCLWGSGIIVDHVDEGQRAKIQSWAINEFLKRTWKNGILDIVPDKAHDLVKSVGSEREEELSFSEGLTRWKAIRFLSELGHLHPRRRQVPMRPVNTMPTWNDIVFLLKCLGMEDSVGIKAQYRTARIVYERYLAATIMHEITGQPYYKIGTYIGDRDHSSVYNGIKRFRSHSEVLPVQDTLLNILSELAENIGVFRAWELHVQKIQRSR